MRIFVLIFFLLIVSSIIYAETSSSSISWISTNFYYRDACRQNGPCNITELEVNNVTSLNVLGDINNSVGGYNIQTNNLIFTEGEYITSTTFDDLNLYCDDDMNLIAGGELVTYSDVRPSTNLNFNLGSSTYRWDNIYTSKVTATGNISGENLYSSDDAQIEGDLLVGGNITATGTITAATFSDGYLGIQDGSITALDVFTNTLEVGRNQWNYSVKVIDYDYAYINQKYGYVWRIDGSNTAVISAQGFKLYPGVGTLYGTSQATIKYRNQSTSANTLAFGAPDNDEPSRIFLFSDYADVDYYNWNLLNQTNPTMILSSSNPASNERLSLTQNGSKAIISTTTSLMDIKPGLIGFDKINVSYNISIGTFNLFDDNGTFVIQRRE